MAQNAGEVKVIFAADTSSWSAALDKAQAQLNKLKGASGEAGRELKAQMQEGRGAVMVLGEEIGVHLPRHVQKFVAELPGVARVMSTAFNAIAIIAIGQAIYEATQKLAEFVAKNREAAEKIKKAQEDYGETVETVFRNYNQKMLEAGIQTDELAGNHLGALRKQLELINDQGFDNLLAAFDKISAKAQDVFKTLQSGWLDTIAAMLSSGVYGSGVPGVIGSERDYQLGLKSFRDKNDLAGAQGYSEKRLDRESHILALENALLKNPGGPQAGNIADILGSNFGVTDVTAKVRDAQQAFVGEIDDTIRAIKAQTSLTGQQRGNAITKEQIDEAKELRKELDANLKLMGSLVGGVSGTPLANLRTPAMLEQQKLDAQMLGAPFMNMTNKDTEWITGGPPGDLKSIMSTLGSSAPNLTLSAMGELTNTVRELSSQFTNLGQILSETVTRSLGEFNNVVAGMISGKHGETWARAGQEVTATVARSGLQYAEGSLLKGLFGANNAKLGTRGNPMYVRSADLGSMVPGVGGSGSSGGSVWSKILGTAIGFLPGHAAGGSVSSNMPSIVGENGPEIFNPSSSGRIIPNGQAFGGGDTHVHVDARGAGDPAETEASVHRAMRAYMGMVPSVALASVRDYNSRRPKTSRIG
jgi:hypothetical protein